MSIYSITERPELIERAAQWFHEKWNVPLEAYRESMQDSLTANGVPQWYVLLGEDDAIIAGLGVIANDFHKRKDLTPNICAVYVEEPFRKQGIARMLLDHACAQLDQAGIADAYLITGHTQFYERCGWDFYGIIEEDDGSPIRMYHRKCKK